MLSVECRIFGLGFNMSKTKVMGLNKRREQLVVNVTLEGGALEKVSSFRYLGSLVCEDAKCDRERRSRIAIEKAAFRPDKYNTDEPWYWYENEDETT